MSALPPLLLAAPSLAAASASRSWQAAPSLAAPCPREAASEGKAAAFLRIAAYSACGSQIRSLQHHQAQGEALVRAGLSSDVSTARSGPP